MVFTAIFAITPGARVAVAQTAVTTDSIESLTLSRERVRAERRRWEKLVEVQKDLAQHPHRLAEATEDAAREMKGAGTGLVVEGLTGGLSNFLSLQAEYARAAGDGPLAERYRLAGTLVSASHTLLIKDLVTPHDPSQRKPSAAANDTINKLNTALTLVIVTQVKDPIVRDGLTASLDLSKGLSGFLTAYLNGDEITMMKLLPATQAVLAGTLTMTKALATKASKEELQNLAVTLSARIPAFGRVATMMTTTALKDANLSLALANIGWGSYAFSMGLDLEAQAEEIRDDQQRAAVKLQRLLPRAKVEIARANEIEQRLTASIEAMQPAPPPPRIVLPSTSFVDNWVLQPSSAKALPDTLSAVGATPSLVVSITVKELERKQDQFRDATQEEREEERRRLEEARRAARKEARRRVAEQRLWAQRADIENDTRSAPSSSHSVSADHSSSYDMSRPRRALENARTWRLP
jgi:hypothetical protein